MTFRFYRECFCCRCCVVPVRGGTSPFHYNIYYYIIRYYNIYDIYIYNIHILRQLTTTLTGFEYIYFRFEYYLDFHERLGQRVGGRIKTYSRL